MRYSLIVLAILLGGCGLLGQDIAPRSADYYNYMAGQTPKLAYSSFLSPAYRGQMTAAAIKEYDEFMRGGDQPNTRYPAATTADIRIAEQEGFAITVVDPGLGPLFAAQRPVLWVRDGRQWYLYLGSDIEIGKYGMFPAELLAPSWEIEEDEPAEDAAE